MKLRDYLEFAIGLILILLLLNSNAHAEGLDAVACMEKMSWATGLLILAGIFILGGLIAILVAIRRDPNCGLLQPFDHRVGGRVCFNDRKGLTKP